MCGISGVVGVSGSVEVDTTHFLESMKDGPSRRGPDSDGYFFESELNAFLYHARLAILDLSPTGGQPMRSNCGNYIIVFNGEIYNHRKLRSLVEIRTGWSRWRGTSDTESLIEAISTLGLNFTLSHLDGMWAFCLLDLRQKKLHLSRDIFGEKPLYWGFMGPESERTFAFTSDLNVYKNSHLFRKSLSRTAFALFAQLGYVPEPYTIYSHFFKLKPGHLLSLQLPYHVGDRPSIEKVSDISASALSSIDNRIPRNLSLDAVENALISSVTSRLQADLPVAVLLSGGIDSSLIAAIAAKKSQLNNVTTFTVSSTDPVLDESRVAQSVANYLGTDHHQCSLELSTIPTLINQLNSAYAEPFADPSALPTLLVSSLVKKHGFSIALTGDGADELFGGYERHLFASRFPIPAEKCIFEGLNLFRREVPGLLSGVASLFPSSSLPAKFARLFSGTSSTSHVYARFATHYFDLYSIIDPSFSASLHEYTPVVMPDAFTMVQKFKLWDTLDYLPGDLLVKTDRASMFNSLELRSPFLSLPLFELAWKLSSSDLVTPSTGKVVLRNLLSRYLPDKICKLPKKGFCVPISSLLRYELRDWADELLTTKSLLQTSCFNIDSVRQIWASHLNGHDHSNILWKVLIFQSWASAHGGVCWAD